MTMKRVSAPVPPGSVELSKDEHNDGDKMATTKDGNIDGLITYLAITSSRRS